MAESFASVVRLSSGASWVPRPDEPPYLLAELGHPWPAESVVSIVFSDTSGGELLELDGEVNPQAISFFADPEQVDPIPAGSRFEIFLETPEGAVHKIRYGKVVRHEAPLSNAPVASLSNQMRQFSDTFPTLGLRSNWKAVNGRTSVHKYGSLPNSVGPNFDALFSKSAIRWDTPLNSNSAKVHVSVIDPSPIVVSAKFATILCADQRFTTYLAAVMESSSGTNYLRLVTGNGGPYSWTDRVDPITHNVVNGDDYTIIYDDITHKLLIYQGEDTTPLRSWPDTLGVVPHGPGYTYLGMAFQASLTPLGPGVQPTGWQAQDGI